MESRKPRLCTKREYEIMQNDETIKQIIYNEYENNETIKIKKTITIITPIIFAIDRKIINTIFHHPTGNQKIVCSKCLKEIKPFQPITEIKYFDMKRFIVHVGKYGWIPAPHRITDIYHKKCLEK